MNEIAFSRNGCHHERCPLELLADIVKDGHNLSACREQWSDGKGGSSYLHDHDGSDCDAEDMWWKVRCKGSMRSDLEFRSMMFNKALSNGDEANGIGIEYRVLHRKDD